MSSISAEQAASDYSEVVNTAAALWHPDGNYYMTGPTSPYNDFLLLGQHTNQYYKAITTRVLNHLLEQSRDKSQYGALSYASTGAAGTKSVLWKTATDLGVLPQLPIECYCGLDELCRVIHPFAHKVVESAIAKGTVTEDEVKRQYAAYEAALTSNAG